MVKILKQENQNASPKSEDFLRWIETSGSEESLCKYSFSKKLISADLNRNSSVELRGIIV